MSRQSVPDLIKLMTKGNTEIVKSRNGFVIIQLMYSDSKSEPKKSLLSSKTGVDRRFYGFFPDKDYVIGKGSYGVIYKAYAIDPTSGKMAHNNSIVIKQIEIATFDKAEHQIGSNYIPMYPPIQHGEYVYLPQPFRGKALYKHPDVPRLSSRNLLSLITNLVFKLHEMHCPTLSSGMVIVHGDIKSDNILLELVYNKHFQLQRIEVTFIDFGLSLPLKKILKGEDDKLIILDNDDPQDLYRHTFPGNYYLPEETKTAKKEYGIKTDVWQTAAVIAELFGYIDNPEADDLALSQKQYSLSRLTRVEEFKFGAEVNQILLDFINRMRHEQYDSRPDSREVLKFFTLLGNFHKTNLPEEKELLQEQLLGLAEGSWTQNRHFSVSSCDSEDSSSSSQEDEEKPLLSVSGNSFSTFATRTEKTLASREIGQVFFDDLFCLN